MNQGAGTALRPGQMAIEFFGGPMDGKVFVYDTVSLRENVFWKSTSTGELEVYVLVRSATKPYEYRHVPEAVVG